MGITIAPAGVADVKPMIRLNALAFPDMYAVLFDGPIKESTIDAIAEHRIKKLLEAEEKDDGKEAPSKRFFAFKAIDDETGQIVGEARWIVYYEDEPVTKTIEEEANDRVSPLKPQMQVGPNIVFGKALVAAQRDVLRIEKTTDSDSSQVILRKRVYLAVLAVHPDHQRKGIGRKLIQWGLDEADRLGLIAYLEASPDGLRLYEQTGFEKVKEAETDWTPFIEGGRFPFTVSLSCFLNYPNLDVPSTFA